MAKHEGKTYGGFLIHKTYCVKNGSGNWLHKADVECLHCGIKETRELGAVKKNKGGCRACALKAVKERPSEAKHPLYHTWYGMLARCQNPKAQSYRNYGGRGITVCDRWHKFENFYADMGDRPSNKHSIDRIDVDGPYSPENCRWATWEEQANNKRNTVWIEFQGERLSAAQWGRRLGVVSDLHAIAKKYNRSLASVVAAFVGAVEDGKHASPAKALGITRPLQTKEEALARKEEALARNRRRYAENVAAKNARRAAEMHRRLRLDVFDKEFFEGERLDDLLSSLDTLFDEDS